MCRACVRRWGIVPGDSGPEPVVDAQGGQEQHADHGEEQADTDESQNEPVLVVTSGILEAPVKVHREKKDRDDECYWRKNQAEERCIAEPMRQFDDCMMSVVPAV